MSENKKVTPIKYKQLDNDPEFKEVTNEMEKYFFGDKGVGFLESLGLTPGRTQKFLDDEFDRNVETILDKYKDYIIIERSRRCADDMNDWIRNNNGSVMPLEQYEVIAKKAELEIIEELMKKEGFI